MLVRDGFSGWLRYVWHRWLVLPLSAGELAKTHDKLAAQVSEQTAALREQARRADYLVEAGAEMGRTLDFDESLQTAAEAIYGLGRLSYVIVMTGHGELGPYTALAARGLAPDMAAQVVGHEYAVPLWGVMARALVSRQPVVIDDIVGQGRRLAEEFNWDVEGGSVMLFPVCGANGPIVCLIAGSREPGRFSSGPESETVWALARIASQSIQNARLYQDAVRSQEQFLTLQVISRLVASNAPIETVLDVLLREVTEMMGAGPAWLYLRADGAGRRTLFSRPLTPVDAWGSVDQNAVDWVLQAGQPIFYNAAQPLEQSPILVSNGPAMCVPLDAGDETLGALVLQSCGAQRFFIEDDMIVLRTLANAAAVALHNRQLVRHFEGGFVELAKTW
ncbi:MAG TPA: GAF domain-containing protein, partial [Anaerolineae bacterium]